MAETFAQLGLGEQVLAAVAENGWTQPTPVQQLTIPEILNGKNVIVESPTGTGKTLSYLLPIMERLQPDGKEPQALILAPTHELAMQIYREARKVAKSSVQIAALIGGVDPKRQVAKLKNHPALIVGTPGRIGELAESRKLKLHQVKSVVVDEADRLAEPSYHNLVASLFKRLKRDTQKMLFSATMSASVLPVLSALVGEAEVIKAEAPPGGEEVRHFYLASESRKKVETLRRLLYAVGAKSAIVFVNTMDKAEEIEAKLLYHHLPCRQLHADTSKEERARRLDGFRRGAFPVLIATDLAARGIDIPDVELVVHFDPATDADTYLHRSGRTGRMGRAGMVISIMAPHELFLIKKFQHETQLSIAERILSFGRLALPSVPSRKAGKERRSGGKLRPKAPGGDTPKNR